MSEKLEEGQFIGNHPCDDCGSSDALSIYVREDGSHTGFCRAGCSVEDDLQAFKSNYKLSKTSLAETLGIVHSGKAKRGNKPTRGTSVTAKKSRVKKKAKTPITKKERQNIELNTTSKGKGYRGIDDKWNKFYGVLTEFDEDTGDPKHRYYPSTTGSLSKGDVVLVGYQRRDFPKDFRAIGINSKEINMFGQFRAKGNGKYLLIAGGQEDVLAAKQMLEGARKDNYAPVDVVCGTVGETSNAAQMQMHYEFIDSYENVIVNLDSDRAGIKATEALVAILPPNKTRVMENPEGAKDACEALMEGLEDDYVREFYAARKPKLEGIVQGMEMFDEMVLSAQQPLIPLPPMLKPLEDKLCGGFPYAEIINILAACVDSDTEFFTGFGWKKIADYERGDLVGQYNPDGTMSLVEPLEYIKEPCDKMTRISTGRGLDQVMSDEHNFVYWQPHKKTDPSAMKKIPCNELVDEHLSKNSGFSRGSVKGFFDYSGVGLGIKEGELRLQVAVMADGRIVKEGKDNYTQMRFKKKRKYDRLISICQKYNLRFDDRGINSEGEYQVIVWPKYRDKYFDIKYYLCSKIQLETILDEVKYWDGCENTGTFSTTIKESADFIQFAYSATGVRSTISLDSRVDKYLTGYCATVYPTKNGFVGLTKGGAGEGALVEDYTTKDGHKYCFTVPSGFLVLRRNNKIFITGNSGIGKTTITNNLIEFWIFFSPYKIGILSLEAGAGKFLTRLVSGYLGRNISRLSSVKKKIKWLMKHREECEELFMNEDGEERFCLVDDKGELDSLSAAKKTIERMIRQGGCKVIIIDPIQDLLDSLPIEDQAAFVGWQKKVKARDGVTFINVNHTRKSAGSGKAGSQGGELTEEDMQGTSALYKSGAVNIIITRDKTAESEDDRNTTKVLLVKSRDAGDTGPAGELFYEISSSKLYNKEDWLHDNPTEV